MRWNRALVLVGTLSVGMLLTGCGDDGGDDDATSDTTAADAGATSAEPSTETGSEDGSGVEVDLDVCALLDDETVAGVLGEPATPTDQSTGPLLGCSWEGQSDALNVLSVSIMVHPDAATAKEQYDATREGLGGSDITGLGDEASYTESFGLDVLAGRYDMSVDNTGPAEKESDLEVAQIVLDQLPT